MKDCSARDLFTPRSSSQSTLELLYKPILSSTKKLKRLFVDILIQTVEVTDFQRVRRREKPISHLAEIWLDIDSRPYARCLNYQPIIVASRVLGTFETKEATAWVRASVCSNGVERLCIHKVWRRWIGTGICDGLED